MSHINHESLEGWKNAFAKDGIVYDSDEEYLDAIHNLVGFVDTLIEVERSLKVSDHSENDTGGMYVFDSEGNKVIL